MQGGSKMKLTFEQGVVSYEESSEGWGFVACNHAIPVRKVEREKLYAKDGAVWVVEQDADRLAGHYPGATHYNLGGIMLRVDVEPGTHHIEVECAGSREDMLVSVNGMNPDAIQNIVYWDAAELVPNRNRAVWEGQRWSFSLVHASPSIVVEVEPLKAGVPVGIYSVSISNIEISENGQKEKDRPTIFILGDSTAQSFVFEETPMNSWGQCFYRMVDPEKANVVNYSRGGRSLKVMYTEGRFNDLLLAGRPGDYLLLQSGHNDERDRNDGKDPDGEWSRFGRGNTEEMFEQYLKEVFLPAVRLRGMIPILVTPTSRIPGDCADDTVFENSFTNRKFPDVMCKVSQETNTPLLHLTKKSVIHFNEIGAIAARSIVMTMEPGESPGKTNSGSYANGNPLNHPDGTHYKEALSRQYCRMLTEEIYRLRQEQSDESVNKLYDMLTDAVKDALKRNDFGKVFPEVCADTVSGENAYYRNQIEKMVQLQVFHKDVSGCFRPKETCTAEEFVKGIRLLWNLPENCGERYTHKPLTRENAACILYEAYVEHFGENVLLPYMTDYNGISITPSDPGYDANIPIGATVYYPLVPVERLEDLDEIEPDAREKVCEIYRLGIMRSEEGIRRGSLENGKRFCSKELVSREKAAKILYFCFVLDKPVKIENGFASGNALYASISRSRSAKLFLNSS